MNQLKIFEKAEFGEIRTVEIDDQIYFVANDVAKALGYTNPSKATNDHCKNSQMTWGNDSLGRRQEFKVIPKGDVIRLATKSKLPGAEKFESWIFDEVIPAVMQHGGYLTPKKIEEALTDPDTIIQLATNLKEERTKRLVAEQRINELQPKATYYDMVLQNKSLLAISVIAKDYGMGAKTMNKLLNELGVQYKQGDIWLLYAKYQDKGYTQTSTHVIDDAKSKVSTKWTQKGRLFIYDLLKKERGLLPIIEREQSA